MMAARQLGRPTARMLKYAHSGEVSGDYTGVVGYPRLRSGRLAPDRPSDPCYERTARALLISRGRRSTQVTGSAPSVPARSKA